MTPGFPARRLQLISAGPAGARGRPEGRWGSPPASTRSCTWSARLPRPRLPSVSGESGVGKEVFAHAAPDERPQQQDLRGGNCAAIPSSRRVRSCSASSAAPSPGRCKAALGALSARTAEPCSSTRSARPAPVPRGSCPRPAGGDRAPGDMHTQEGGCPPHRGDECRSAEEVRPAVFARICSSGSTSFPVFIAPLGAPRGHPC